MSDQKIKELNFKYRHKNKPTDVLSFPVGFLEKRFPIRFLGDIVISVNMALREAKRKKIPFEDELKNLLIHGILHLIGYDHEKSLKEEIRMKRMEKRYFKLLEQHSLVGV